LSNEECEPVLTRAIDGCLDGIVGSNQGRPGCVIRRYLLFMVLR
jgi:hypothetical protein